MKPRFSVITLPAREPAILRAFYEEAFGWVPVASNADIAFYPLNGMLLSIASRQMLEDFIGIALAPADSSSVLLSHNVATREEVFHLHDHLVSRAEIVVPPTSPSFGGLFFYFRDPEGHLLEVAWNPYVTLDEEGMVTGHLPIDHLS